MAGVNDRDQETARQKKELKSRKLRATVIFLTFSVAVILTVFILSARMRIDVQLPAAAAKNAADLIIEDVYRSLPKFTEDDGNEGGETD